MAGNRLFLMGHRNAASVTDDASEADISLRKKLGALYKAALYRPSLSIGVVLLSVFAALLEGLGLGFLIPIIEVARGNATRGEISGYGELFLSAYEAVGIPFQLSYIIAGVALVMILRYTASFLVAWLQTLIKTDYTRHLQSEGFGHALDANVGYYDKHGSDEVLNAIVTQAEYASSIIRNGIRLLEQGVLSLMYLAIAIAIAPWLTVGTAVVLGVVLYGMWWLLESGYVVGDRVADANERLQEAAQAGTQGIHEVKLFGVADDLYTDFQRAADQYVSSQVKLGRNKAAINNFYQMATAITVFGLIYVALTVASLTLASLGVFLFAMFRLAPRVSTLNDIAYSLDGNLPHLVRTHQFIEELRAQEEVDEGAESPPQLVNQVAFEDVSFAYENEQVLEDLSFAVDRGEFVAFVGESGAGKSTIVSLLARLYDPDRGEIKADGTPINRFVLAEWRDRISVVRQDPHMFNDTLRYNVTLGNPNATEERVCEACEIAQVTEFIDDLPRGLDTELGDDGARLSGGQRQRVAIARALLKPADVLVLDEATSDLDTTLERRVHEGIETLSDYAMIVIAHRLSTVTGADRIYAMADGKIRESGPHSELVEYEGVYNELYAKQA
jgi:subfamily B ATP-binding cassette protein MsbA